LKYPIPKDRLVALAKLYFQISLTPGLSTLIVATCADEFKELTESKHKITIEDMRLPWKPIYDILSQDLFLSRRQFEYRFVSSVLMLAILFSMIGFSNFSHLSWCMGYIAENSRKFFHPAAINEILSTFLPLFDGTKLDVSSLLFLGEFSAEKLN
jgi:proteasome activator subunit 4